VSCVAVGRRVETWLLIGVVRSVRFIDPAIRRVYDTDDYKSSDESRFSLCLGGQRTFVAFGSVGRTRARVYF
jgi:hypothetical protein